MDINLWKIILLSASKWEQNYVRGSVQTKTVKILWETFQSHFRGGVDEIIWFIDQIISCWVILALEWGQICLIAFTTRQYSCQYTNQTVRLSVFLQQKIFPPKPLLMGLLIMEYCKYLKPYHLNDELDIKENCFKNRCILVSILTPKYIMEHLS